MSDDLRTVEEEIAIHEKESKADAFKRLAIPRVENILDRIRILSNLSDTARYEYSEIQIDKIETALNEAVATTIKAFRGKDFNTKFEL